MALKQHMHSAFHKNARESKLGECNRGYYSQLASFELLEYRLEQDYYA